MTLRPDIVVRSRDDQPLAIIEIKNRREWPDSFAIEFRQNMIVHGGLPTTRFFLLVSQRKGFIWKEGGDPSDYQLERSPDAEFSTEEIVRRYAPKGFADRWLREAELEYIILQWLDDLASGIETPTVDAERALAEVGFLEAILDSSVLAQSVT